MVNYRCDFSDGYKHTVTTHFPPLPESIKGEWKGHLMTYEQRNVEYARYITKLSAMKRIRDSKWF